MPAKAKTAAPTTLELDYNLAGLPSSQHRAGLAGLVLMVKWLQRQNRRNGIYELLRLNERGATLRLDQAGLQAIFDEVYAAKLEESPTDKKRTNQKKPPHEEKVKVLDEKTGKEKEKTIYVYEDVIPQGAFLVEHDPSAKGDKGDWVKLWRDMTWNILRGVPATRHPFEARANSEETNDAVDAWKDLVKPATHTVELPSTYYIGAQAANAENVPFRDRARYQFLLHFWSYVAGIYVPVIINNKGERDLTGNAYVIAIPDVLELQTFVEILPRVWERRGVEVAGFRPRDAVIDLVAEGALDMLSKLRERMAARAGESELRFLVLGIDVLHVEKQGNSIKLRGQMRIDPEVDLIGKYEQLRRSLWNPLFRRQRLLNLVNRRKWYEGFDKLLATLPHKKLLAEDEFGFKYFRRDARLTFEEEFGISPQEDVMSEEIETAHGAATAPPPADETSVEALVYRIAETYIRRKLNLKHPELKWDAAKRDPKKKDEYNEKRGKIARDAFLAVRSRTGADFIDYFASTLCSVPQHMNEQHFQMLTQALYNDTDRDRVRTLTLLALSARG
jgi:CRISPR-associated protein Cmx8